jgi:hypothetical protein
LLAEFTALKARYTRARDGQVESKGDLAHARAALAAARCNRTTDLRNLDRSLRNFAS